MPASEPRATVTASQPVPRARPEPRAERATAAVSAPWGATARAPAAPPPADGRSWPPASVERAWMPAPVRRIWSALRARTRAAKRPSLLLEALVVGWLAWLYDLLTNLAPLRAHLALANGISIWHAEQAIGLDPERPLNHWLAAHFTVGQVASYYYDNAHFFVTLGLLAYLWWRKPSAYRPLRSALVLVNLIGFAVFWLCPVAPPRMLPGAGFFDVVGHSGTFGQWHTGSLATSADQFAAMPSLHVAWALWCGVALWRIAPRPAFARGRVLVRALAVIYPCLTTLDVFATGNHYLLDALAGAATTVLAIALVAVAPRAWRAWGRRRGMGRGQRAERRPGGGGRFAPIR